MARRTPNQLRLEIAQRQARNVSPERADFYHCVVAMRRRGHQVYRAGELIKVNDASWDRDHFLRLAGAVLGRSNIA